MKRNLETYKKLFTSTFYLSAFTFGGGYVIIPLMKKKFVEELQWLEDEEMMNLAAIAQSAPGAVAVNASILLGYRIAGLKGALVTIFGTVLPPLLILSVISMFYVAFRENIIVQAVLKAMQAAVAAVICDVVISMSSSLWKEKQVISMIVMLTAFCATYFFQVNVILIVIICGLFGAAMMGVKLHKAKVALKQEVQHA